MRKIWLIGGLVWLAGCRPAAPPPDTRAADAEAIHRLEVQWSRDSEDKNLEALVAHYSEDAIVYSPDSAPLRGKDAIRKGFAEAHKIPGFSLTWKDEKVEVSRSGDVAYSRGPYVFKMTGPKGEPVVQHGHYVAVWKKQADGAWKAIEDIATTDEKAH
jgi:uncharacterized protein (TIGR02246 family)